MERHTDRKNIKSEKTERKQRQKDPLAEMTHRQKRQTDREDRWTEKTLVSFIWFYKQGKL